MILLGLVIAAAVLGVAFMVVSFLVIWRESAPLPPAEQRHVVVVDRRPRPYDWERDGI